MHNKGLNELLKKVNVVKMHCSTDTVLMVLEDKKTNKESFLLVDDMDCHGEGRQLYLQTGLLTYDELIDTEATQLCFMSETRRKDYRVNEGLNEESGRSRFTTSALSSLSWLDYKDDKQMAIDVNNRLDELMEPSIKALIELKDSLAKLQSKLISDKNYEDASIVRLALHKI